MRKPVVILLVVLVLAGLFVFFKNLIARSLVQAAFRQVTGAPLEIKKFSFSLFRSTVEAKGVKIYNPPAFPDRMMVDLPAFRVNLDLGAYFKGKIHIRELKMDIASLYVLRNSQAAVNLESLKALQPKGQGKPPEMKIDVVEFSLDKVIYKDYVFGSPLEREFRVNIRENFSNITDPYMLVNAIVARALKASSLSLPGLNMGKLNNDLNKAAEKTSEDIRRTLEEKAGSALQKFREQLGGGTNTSR